MYKILFLFITSFLFTTVLIGQGKIIFRYNSAYELDSDLNSPVELVNLLTFDNLNEKEDIARGNEGWGYEATKILKFNDTSSLQSNESVGISFFGSVEISGEIWFNSQADEGILLVWDDDESKKFGVQIFIKEGLLHFEAKINDSVNTIVSNSVLPLDEWLRTNWLLKISDRELKLTLYENNKIVAENTFELPIAPGLVIFNSSVKFGQTSYSHPELSNFNGYLSALIIRNYIPQEKYLNSYLPLDGTSYLGIPRFHDFPLTSSEETVDQRISQNNTPIDLSVFIPYVNDEFIPQGLTNSYEDEDYIEDNGYIYFSMYNRTVEGVTRQKRSIIVELDPSNDYKVRRCFRLKGTLGYSHAGGIAYKNNSIFVSSARSIEKYELPEYAQGEKYIDLNTSTSNLFGVQSIASFVTYYKDSIWVGDYVSGSENAYLFGYALDNDGNVVNNKAPKIYRLPSQSQGVAWINYNNQEYLFVSSSTGNNTSTIYRFRKENLSMTAIAESDSTYKIPTGAEDISFDKDGRMLNISESGALYYQKRTNPWDDFYPFFFIINKDNLFKDIPVGVNNSKTDSPLEKNFQLNSYPNPFNGQLSIKYSLPSSSIIAIKVYDFLGREVDIIKERTENKSGEYISKWTPKNISAGAYFIALLINGKLTQSKKVIYLK